MEQNQNKIPVQGGGTGESGSTPQGLPVTDNKTFRTRTMEEDVAKAHAQGQTGASADTAPKPFGAHIPPPPVLQHDDAFREKIEPAPAQRDQPITLPGSAHAPQPNQKRQFQIQVPQKKGSNMLTSILIIILTALIAVGGFGYYWFFIKPADTQTAEVSPPPPPPPPIVPRPVLEEPPQIPEPPPAQEFPEQSGLASSESEEILLPPPDISQSEPAETPASLTETPTSTTTPTPAVAEPVSTTTSPQEPAQETESTPVVLEEPAIPDALFALDQTIVITMPAIDNLLLREGLAKANAGISESEATVRYLVKLSNESEKRFLSGEETASLLELNLSSEFWVLVGDTFELVGYKNGDTIRYGFVSAHTDKETMKTFARGWESGVLSDVRGLYLEKMYVLPETVAFSQNTYFDFDKRYINMLKPDVSFDYAVSGKYFVTATSKDMIYALLDDALGFDFGQQ